MLLTLHIFFFKNEDRVVNIDNVSNNDSRKSNNYR